MRVLLTNDDGITATGLNTMRRALIESGINHGANLGDDITYSGTVAAALEGIMLGIPAIAVSLAAGTEFGPLAAFVARMVDELDDVPMPDGTLLNVNGPGGDVKGACACRLGKRVYNDKMELTEEEGGRRRYRLYGEEPGYEHEPSTDFAAIADGLIAVTPIHFDLTDQAGVEELAGFDLERLLRPATEAVE